MQTQFLDVVDPPFVDLRLNNGPDYSTGFNYQSYGKKLPGFR